jgi:hypothetical protein
MNELKNKICQQIAFLIPRRLLYFCVISVWAQASCRKYTTLKPDEITFNMACDYLEDNNKF